MLFYFFKDKYENSVDKVDLLCSVSERELEIFLTDLFLLVIGIISIEISLTYLYTSMQGCQISEAYTTVERREEFATVIYQKMYMSISRVRHTESICWTNLYNCICITHKIYSFIKFENYLSDKFYTVLWRYTHENQMASEFTESPPVSEANRLVRRTNTEAKESAAHIYIYI